MIPSWLLPMLGQMGGTAAGTAASAAPMIGGMNPAMLAMMAGPEILKMLPAFQGKDADKASQGLLPIWWHLTQKSGLGPFGGGLIGGLRGLFDPQD